MLTTRFPFLSIVPEAVRATHLLDRDKVYMRFEMYRLSPKQMAGRAIPFSEHPKICEALQFGGGLLPIGVHYAVEINEVGSVKMNIGGKTSSGDAAIRILLDQYFQTLWGVVKKHAHDLHDLPSVEQVRSVLDEAIVLHIENLQQFDKLK